jgi:hypothetical protein
MGTVESHPVRLEQGCPRVRPASHARERRTGNATAADTGHDGVGAGRPATVSDWRKAAPNRSAATAPVVKERRLP